MFIDFRERREKGDRGEGVRGDGKGEVTERERVFVCLYV